MKTVNTENFSKESETAGPKNITFFKDAIFWIGLLALWTICEYGRYSFHLRYGWATGLLSIIVLIASAFGCKWSPTRYKFTYPIWCLFRFSIALVLIRHINGYCSGHEIERRDAQTIEQFKLHNANPREWVVRDITHPKRHFFDFVDRRTTVYQRVVMRNGELVLSDEKMEITTE